MNPDRLKNPVYGWRRDSQQGTGNIRRELAEELNISGKPDRQDGFEGFTDSLILIDGRFSSCFCLGFYKAFEPFEKSDGVFAVTFAGGTEFIQEGDFFTTGGIFIP